MISQLLDTISPIYKPNVKDVAVTQGYLTRINKFSTTQILAMYYETIRACLFSFPCDTWIIQSGHNVNFEKQANPQTNLPNQASSY
jgi:hypothetical protein